MQKNSSLPAIYKSSTQKQIINLPHLVNASQNTQLSKITTAPTVPTQKFHSQLLQNFPQDLMAQNLLKTPQKYLQPSFNPQKYPQDSIMTQKKTTQKYLQRSFDLQNLQDAITQKTPQKQLKPSFNLHPYPQDTITQKKIQQNDYHNLQNYFNDAVTQNTPQKYVQRSFDLHKYNNVNLPDIFQIPSNNPYDQFSSQLSLHKQMKINKNKLPSLRMMNESRVNPNAIAKNKSSYDLEKGLSLEIKTLQNHFQFGKNNQTLPVMVSVKTLENTDNQLAKAKNIDSRPSVDLICVIDNSTSMEGDKINNVKSALIQLIDMLKETDRLSLILFNSYPTLLSNLRTITPENKTNFINIINGIESEGGTEIAEAMKMAFSVLGNRKETNPVTSIFLLSDGQDDDADYYIKYELENGNGKVLEQKGEIFTIHSFGFGSDHDGPLMNRICELKDGNFYYVEQIEQVGEFFVDALGGLFSVIAQEVEISINLNINDLIFKKFFKGSFISKTYGDMWKVVKEGEAYKITINQLFSGISKDFIMEVTIPGNTKVNKLLDLERNAKLIQASLTAIPIEIKDATKIAVQKNLYLTLFTQNEKITTDSQINEEVEFNYFRVKAASAIEEAIKFSEKRLYGESQVALDGILFKISNSHPKNSSKLAIISKDIMECKQNSLPQVYESVGKYKLLSKKVANFKQSSYAVEDQDLYQSCSQKRMVRDYKLKKIAKSMN